MLAVDRPNVVAVLFSLALHAAVLALVSGYQFGFRSADKESSPSRIIFMQVQPPPQDDAPMRGQELSPAIDSPNPTALGIAPITESTDRSPPAKEPATMAAPSAPTAEDWAFAGSYTNKNSKGYRYSWGQQVRSMMGTAYEGTDQGQVRFSVEIAPNGSITRVDTIWKTSVDPPPPRRQSSPH